MKNDSSKYENVYLKQIIEHVSKSKKIMQMNWAQLLSLSAGREGREIISSKMW